MCVASGQRTVTRPQGKTANGWATSINRMIDQTAPMKDLRSWCSLAILVMCPLIIFALCWDHQSRSQVSEPHAWSNDSVLNDERLLNGVSQSITLALKTNTLLREAVFRIPVVYQTKRNKNPVRWPFQELISASKSNTLPRTIECVSAAECEAKLMEY
jgi:hypothetical protein